MKSREIPRRIRTYSSSRSSKVINLGANRHEQTDGRLTVAMPRYKQGRIYSKPGPVQKKMWGPRAPNTIIGLLLQPTVPSITSLPDCLHTHTQSCHFIDNRQVVSWRLSVHLSVNSTLDTDSSVTQNFYLIYYFNDFRAISVCWHVAEIFLVRMWGPYFCGGPCSAEHAEHAEIRLWVENRIPVTFLNNSHKPTCSLILTSIGT